MILPDYQLRTWANGGGVKPFDIARINPASIDLCWSGRWKLASRTGWSKLEESESLVLMQGQFFLLDTLENIIIPDDCCGLLALKSSLGRKGLEHLHAGWFDAGFHGTGTLEVECRAPWELVLTKGQPIVQISLIRMEGVPEANYRQTGRYNGQSTPQEAK